MPDVETRRAGPGDVAEVARLFDLYRQFYERPPDRPLAERFIGERLGRGESIVFVAPGAWDRLAGFTQLYPTFCSVAAAPTYLLYDLFVDPPARRGGVARALLEAAARHAQASGAVRLDLSTARSNHAAQRLYESLGWVRDEQFLTYSLKTV
jgi:ribosomal protein S18 acetylase RimI-like enzyme